MDVRDGWLWVVRSRPATDPSGESDFVVAAPGKERCRRLAVECGGTLCDIVHQRWMKEGKAAFIMNMRPDNRIGRLKRISVKNVPPKL